jgi:hypothetical protein
MLSFVDIVTDPKENRFKNVTAFDSQEAWGFVACVEVVEQEGE